MIVPALTSPGPSQTPPSRLHRTTEDTEGGGHKGGQGLGMAVWVLGLYLGPQVCHLVPTPEDLGSFKNGRPGAQTPGLGPQSAQRVEDEEQRPERPPPWSPDMGQAGVVAPVVTPTQDAQAGGWREPRCSRLARATQGPSQ